MIDTNTIPSIIGATARDRHGDTVGSVQQVYVDDQDGHARFAAIATGSGTAGSFVPLDDAEFVGGELRVGYSRTAIDGAPRVSGTSLSVEEERRIAEHYAAAGDATGSGSPVGATGAPIDDDLAGSDDTEGGGTVSAEPHAAETVHTDRSTDRAGRAATSTRSRSDADDDAMTRSEERLQVRTEWVPTGRVRLRKYIVSEERQITVTVHREEVALEHLPLPDRAVDRGTVDVDASDAAALTSQGGRGNRDIVLDLAEERIIVTKEIVPVERVTLRVGTVTEQRVVTEDVSHEEIEFDGDDLPRRG